MDEVTPIDSHKAVSKRKARTPSDQRRNQVADQVCALQIGGMLPSEIATAMGVPYQRVHRILNEGIAQDSSYLTDMERKGLLGLQLMRLEKLLASVWPSAMLGDPKSVHEAADLVMKEARLTQLEVADPVTQKNLVLVMGEREDDYIAALKATQND